MNLFMNKNWQPMLLEQKKHPFDSKDYYFELKLDGTRALIFATTKSIIIKTRHSTDVSFKYPELQNIRKLVTKPTIFDGEITSFINGKPSFKALATRTHLKDKTKIKNQSIINPVTFIAFDILYLAKNLTNLPLEKRKRILNQFPDTEVFIKNKYLEKEGKKLFSQVKKLSLEGIVAKKKDSPYLINTRTTNWLKIKNLKEEEFYIAGFTENTNSYSLYLGEYLDNSLSFVGKVSIAKNNSLMKKVLSEKKISSSPFSNYKEKITYLKPKLKCQVTYLERTKNNHLREPSIK